MPSQTRLSPTRLLLWLALLLSALALAASRADDWLSSSWIPHPIACSAEPPEWLPDLVNLSKALGLPGFQLALLDGHGQRNDCAAGWASLGVDPARMTAAHTPRFVSLSKIFTSAVAMQLAAEGRLALDAKVVELLGLQGPYADPRVGDITVAQLLNHTAGFDRHRTPDPMMAPHPWCPANVGQLKTLRLDHEPGRVYAYANVGYCLLGVLISRIERQPLDEIFYERLFEPAQAASIVPIKRGQVLGSEPRPHFDSVESLDMLLALDYGSMLATGAWAGSASDFLAVLGQLFPVAPTSHRLLPEGWQQTLVEVAPDCDTGRWRHCHGFGFYKYRQTGKQAMYWRDGSLPGVTSFAAVMDDGAIVVFLANHRRHDWMPANDRLGQALYQWLQGK